MSLQALKKAHDAVSALRTALESMQERVASINQRLEQAEVAVKETRDLLERLRKPDAEPVRRGRPPKEAQA